MFRFRSDDSGFTLTELIVVLGLMGFILAAGWAMFDVARAGSNTANRDAWLSREIGQPLDYAERIYMQQLDISFHSSDNVLRDPRWWCLATTDRDHDDRLETYIFQVTADGRLLVTRSEVIDAPTPETIVWSRFNRNRAEGTPLFTYYDSSGADISSESRDIIEQYAASMKITIVAEYDGKILTDSRRIYFRNQ